MILYNRNAKPILNHMLDAVSRDINTKPILLQIAKDEVWEDTWNIRPGTPVADGEIGTYLGAKPFDSLGVEALFEQPEGVYVLGLLYRPGIRAGSEAAFLRKFIDLSAAYGSFREYGLALTRDVIGAPILTGNPDMVRIGVVNHWFSIGPVAVWKTGDPKTMTAGLLDALLDAKPDVRRSPLNYQGMSFLFNFNLEAPGVCHWIKSPCSGYANGVWTVDTAKVRHYLSSWAGITL